MTVIVASLSWSSVLPNTPIARPGETRSTSIVSSPETSRSVPAALAQLKLYVWLVGVSPLRETEPWGPVEQHPYLNGAVALDTELAPRDLLKVLLDVEQSLGRDRSSEVRFGPRTLDLDLLVHGDLVRDEPGLRLPHPRLHERRFALEPLADLDPELVVPGRGTVSELLASLDGGSREDGQG